MIKPLSKEQSKYIVVLVMLGFNVFYITCLLVGYFVAGTNTWIKNIANQLVDIIKGDNPVSHDTLLTNINNLDIKNHAILVGDDLLGKSYLNGVYRHRIIIKSLLLPGLVSVACAGILTSMIKSPSGLLFSAAVLLYIVSAYTIFIILIVFFMGTDFVQVHRTLLSFLLIIYFLFQVTPFVMVCLVEE